MRACVASAARWHVGGRAPAVAVLARRPLVGSGCGGSRTGTGGSAGLLSSSRGSGGRAFSDAAAAGGPDGDAQASYDEYGDSGFSSQEQYRSVVKVFNVMSTPNYLMPWQNKPHRDSTGSGFAIEGRRIITNAHVVADTKHCQVRKHGEASKFTATVVGVSHECDLAMLAVEDDAFWEDVKPLPLGGIPELQEAVTVVGYPTGGDNISVTGGVVSRVDFQQYAHGAANLLAVQIDAAINPGNSGGPAMLNGQVAGVAFQNLIGAENIGFIIPTTIVRHFLDEIEARGVCSFVSLGVLCQPLDSPSLREYLGLHNYPQHVGNGVLVNKVMPLSSASAVLQPKDVLLAFNDEPIGCDGTVHFRGHERTSFDWLVTAAKIGQDVSLLVLRDGQEQELTCTLSEASPLVPVHQYDQLPSYFIVAGFVFSSLTQPYLHEFGDDWYNSSPRRLCGRALHGVRKRVDDEVVVLSQVLAHAINNGYQGYHDLEVRSVNGTTVRNLRHMKALVEGTAEELTLSAGASAAAEGSEAAGASLSPWIEIVLEGSRLVVIPREGAMAATQEILDNFRVSNHCSQDLLPPPSR